MPISAKAEPSNGFWSEPSFSSLFKKKKKKELVSGGLVLNNVVLILDLNSFPSLISTNMHYERSV